MREGFVNPKNVKAINHAYHKQTIKGNFLPSVYIVELTSKCNINCVMCPNNKMTDNNLGSMDIDLFHNILLTISPYAEFVMLYWMGEPLLHPDLPKLLKMARQHLAGKIALSTNMTIFSESAYQSMLENVDIILCSIDRWNKAAFENIRRGAKFDEVSRNTELLLEMKTATDRAEIVVKALDLNRDKQEHKDFTKHWESRGAKVLMAWLNDWAGTFSGLRNSASLPIPHASKSRTACADLWFKMVINWKGHVQICCFDWRYSHRLGEFNTSNWLESVWQSEKVVDLRKRHLNKDYASIDICKSCYAWGEISEHQAYVHFSHDSYFTVF